MSCVAKKRGFDGNGAWKEERRENERNLSQWDGTVHRLPEGGFWKVTLIGLVFCLGACLPDCSLFSSLDCFLLCLDSNQSEGHTPAPST